MPTTEKILTTAAELEVAWGAPFVCRDQRSLDRATGGLVHPRTLANLDSQGLGPAGKFRIGRRVGYPAREFFQWFADRIERG